VCKQNAKDDQLIMIFKGECRVTYKVDKTTPFFEVLTQADKVKSPNLAHYIVIGTCQQGEIFGEHGSLNDLVCPFGVEAVTEEVIAFKISRLAFLKNFGGIGGDVANELRGNIITK
jgi:hypothetical protein